MSTEILSPAQPQQDPLAQITLPPRVFVASLASIALVVGLVLGLLPVRVSTLDTTTTVKVSCGNTLGGVETPQLAASLGRPERPILAEYVAMCDRGIDARALPAWTLFFGGMIGWIWLGAVRRRKSGVE
ncbi:hypothetical protein LWC34_40085 [Kibdelosporangium philippinense]|uniref:Uncharacterized protein n=1 Tax=Kibdelosporangium philippinense TaxID=211113 RepID=A0ABS8ZMF4_9PSEU|nr:hypothetical protein [Kibdelosporangium philippinense]MCE7008970.1 hypothetical protein [Kibdelosporangium philippinense]